MYLPATFNETNVDVLRQLIQAHPLGLLITHGASGLQASPLPFVCVSEPGRLRLRTHMARANPHGDDLKALNHCLVVFQGEQNYITPSWYPSKQSTHKVVPTWNYAMVQVQGRPLLHEDADWLHQQISQMTQHMEGQRPQPWAVSDAPEAFVASQMKAIVGIEIEVTEIKGKWKMSQNRSTEDAQGVVSGLSDAQDPHANVQVAQTVASSLMRQSSAR